MPWLSLSICQSRTQLQKALSLNAGATKRVNSPAAHRGIWYGAGATTAWLHSGTFKKSFAEIYKCLNPTPWAIQIIRESLRDHSRTRIGRTKTSALVISKRVWCVYECMFVHWIGLHFSVFSSTWKLTQVVVDFGSKLKRSSTKWQSPRRIVQLNRRIILSLPDEMIPLSGDHLLRLLDICLLICTPLSLFHNFTAPFGRLSASLDSFSIVSLCHWPFPVHPLIPPHYAYCFSLWCSRKHNTRRCPLFMRVLSHSNTHYLNRHMAWCGCHEILIALCSPQEVFFSW